MKIVIAGAGSSGLGVALAAARKGWKVLILEAKDISSGTSTASTKLIHGGVRYLESAIKRFKYADWHLVREALQERHWMLHSTPALCKPLPIILPIQNKWQQLYYGIGLSLYDYLSKPYTLIKKSWTAKEELTHIFPLLKKGFIGGWRYWDGQFQDRLYAVYLSLFLRQRYGVEIRTYHRVRAIERTGQQVKVQVESPDGSCYEEVGTFFVNATGPWADHLRKLVRPQAPSRLRLSRGSHLVLSRQHLPIREGFLIPRTEDGRLLFVLPWLEDTVLVGTTDVEASEPMWNASVPEEEENYLRSYLHQYFEMEEDFPVQARFAGFRPLVAEGNSPTARLARSHVVEIWPEERFLSLMGGKWTTFRAMGEDAVQAIAQALNLPLPPAEPLSSVEPDLTELETYRRTYPTPAVPGESFCEGEVRYWRRLGWAHRPEDIVEGRWQLSLIDQARAQRAIQALRKKWSDLV